MEHTTKVWAVEYKPQYGYGFDTTQTRHIVAQTLIGAIVKCRKCERSNVEIVSVQFVKDTTVEAVERETAWIADEWSHDARHRAFE